MGVVVLGPITSTNVVDQPLYVEFRDSIEIATEDLDSMLERFCGSPTLKSSTKIYTSSMAMRRLGGANRPFQQHADSYLRTFSTPGRYGVGSAIDAEAWERGVDADALRHAVTMPLKADRRLVIGKIMDSIFGLNQWYGAWMTPPKYMGYTHSSAHTHYLGYNQAGLLDVTVASDAKLHISHHGHDVSGIVGWVNGDQAAILEKSSDFGDTAIMNSPLIQDLQRLGFQPAFPLAGVPHMRNDWVPSGYVAYLAFSEPPLRWHVESEEQKNLIVYTQETRPNAGTYWFGEYVRWVPDGLATCVVPGAGVVVKLDSGTYTAPALMTADAA